MRCAGGIVRSEPEGDRVSTLLVACEVAADVKAFALKRADEAFSAAVCPRVVRLGAGVANAEPRAGPVISGAVAHPVIGEDPPDPDPESVDLRDGTLEEGHAVVPTKAPPQLDEGLAAGGVDRDVGVFPADLWSVYLVALCGPTHAPAAACEPAETFDVDREHLARYARLERAAHDPLRGKELPQPVHAVPPEDPVCGAP